MNGLKHAREILIGGAVVAVIAIAVALWFASDAIPRDGLRGWAVAVTMLLVPGFLAGFWFGKVEARGVLHGFDQSLDRMVGVVSNVMTVRDQSRIAVHKATNPPHYNVVLPGVHELPPITNRAPKSGDIIEL